MTLAPALLRHRVVAQTSLARRTASSRCSSSSPPCICSPAERPYRNGNRSRRRRRVRREWWPYEVLREVRSAWPPVSRSVAPRAARRRFGTPGSQSSSGPAYPPNPGARARPPDDGLPPRPPWARAPDAGETSHDARKGVATSLHGGRLPVRRLDRRARGAAAEIDERLASLPGIVAVYRTGGISAPGISDIDRVAVLEAPASDRFGVGRAWPSAQRAIAMHAPFAVDREDIPAPSLVCLPGAAGARSREFRLPLDREPPHPRYGLDAARRGGLGDRLLKLLKQRSIGRAEGTAALCELHALRHSLRLAMLRRRSAPAAQRLIEDVDEVRQTWFRQQQATA